MPDYSYTFALSREPSPEEHEALAAALSDAWAALEVARNRWALLTPIPRHLKARVPDPDADFPDDHPKAGKKVHPDTVRVPQLYCASCGRALSAVLGGLACPRVADHPAVAGRLTLPCHIGCAIDCGV